MFLFLSFSPRSVLLVLRMLLACLLFSAMAQAHDMRQIKALMVIDEQGWSAGLSIEAWSIYPTSGPRHPSADKRGEFAGKEWVASLREEDLALMQAESKRFLQEAFLLRVQGTVQSFTSEVQSFSSRPISWTYTARGQAVVQVKMVGRWQEQSGPLVFEWNDAFDEPAVLQVTSKNAQGEEMLSVMQVEIREPVVIAEVFPHHVAQAQGTSLFGWIAHGFAHILPKGLDHILFILGLFLLQPNMRALLWQSTAFTVAHSITLGMVIMGWFEVSSSIVEPAIALSIAYVGFENLWVKELKPWRAVFVFLLGLLHGMGFASVMKDLEVPRDHLLLPLIGFNFGVECGQVAILALAFALTAAFLRKPGFQKFRFAASLMIGLTGCYWTVERILS